MTTRKYPRTTLEAFGCKGDLACAIEKPSKRESFFSVLLAIVIGLLLCGALYARAGEEPKELTPAEKKALARQMKREKAVEASFKQEQK